MQLEHDDVPSPDAYVPTRQLKHDDRPDDPAKVPTAQLAHALAPALEYAPEAHDAHTLDAEAPVVPDAVPAAQAEQPDEPGEAW